MKVVVFSPSDSYSSDALPALGDDDEVTIVHWGNRSQPENGRIGVPQGAVAARIVSTASGNVLTRTLVRALPTDTGARFWRATHANAAVRDAVRRADLLVAPEREGGFAAWSWRRLVARKGRDIPAVAGYPAARTAIEQRR